MPVNYTTGNELIQSLQSPVMSPDLSQVQSIAMRANSLFEQNLGQVKNDYSAVLNAPVTGQAMQERKQQYVNNFRSGLSKLATYDISMPQNVLQAENLLQPFWSDQDMLTNIDGTKNATSNIQKVQQGLLSKDPKERDMYSNYQIMDQQDYLQELGDAGTDHDKIAKVQRRPITPFYNINSLATEWAGKDGLKVSYTTGTGTPYLVSTAGGLQTVPNYKTWLRGHIDAEPNMAGMFQTIGRVIANRVKERLQEHDPNLTGQALNDAIANHTYDQMDKSYQGSITNYNTSVMSLDKQIDDLKKRGTTDKNGKWKPVDQEQGTQYMQLLQLKKDQQTFLDKENNDYTAFKSKKDATIQTYADDPTDAFARQEKDHIVNDWAESMASMTEQDIKENTAYTAAQKINYDYNALRVTSAHNRAEEGHWNTEEAGKMMRAGWEIGRDGQWTYTGVGQDDGTGTGKGGVSLAKSAASGTPQADNVDLLHTPATYDTYVKNTITDPIRDANSSLLGVTGLAGTLEGTPIVVDNKSDILNTRDIDIAHDAIQAKFDDPTYVYTPQQLQAVKKLAAAVDMDPTKVDITNPNAIRSALEAKMGKEERDKNGVPTLQSVERASLMTNAQNKIEEALAAHKNMDMIVNHQILSHPDENKHILVNGHIVTSQDLIPAVHNLGLPIPDRELADAYLHGQVIPSTASNGSTVLSVNGKSYAIPYPFDQFSRNSPHDTYNQLVGRFGTSGQLAQNLTDAKNKVIQQIPENQLITGMRGYAATYNADIPVQKPFLIQGAIALSNPANHLLMHNVDGDKPVGQLEKEEVNKVAELLKDPKNVQEFKPMPYAGTNGGPAVRVSFKGEKVGEGKGKPGDIEPVHPPVIIDIDPKTKDKVLQYNQQYAGQTEYGDMVAGKVYEGNSIQQAHGFKPQITPVGRDEGGAYTSVSISGTFPYLNPSTGKVEIKNLKDALIQRGGTNLYSFNNQTPRAIIDETNKEFINIMKQNEVNYNTYRNNARANNLPSFTDIEKQFNQ